MKKFYQFITCSIGFYLEFSGVLIHEISFKNLVTDEK